MIRKIRQRFIANRWIVNVASVLVTIVDFGILFSLGVMFVPLLDKYQTSRSAMALVQSLMIGMTGLGILSGLLIAKFDLRIVSFVGSVLLSFGFISAFFATSVLHLYVLISIIAGIGVINLFMCATVAVDKVFDGRARLTALAVQMSGIGIGAACYPYFLRYLMSTYGINGTFLILGGMYMNNFCVVILFGKNDVSNKTKLPDHEEKECTLEHVGDATNLDCNCYCCSSVLARFKRIMLSILSAPYVLTLMATTVGQSSLDGFSTVFADIYIWKGFSEEEGVGSAISYNICTILARILAGFLKQIKGFDSLAIPVTSTLLGCGGSAVIYYSKSYIVAYVGSGLLGISVAGIIAGFGMVVAELVPDEQFGPAFGLINTAIAIFSIATGPIYGAIRDDTKSYAPVLLTLGIMQFTAAVLFMTALVQCRLSWTKTFQINS